MMAILNILGLILNLCGVILLFRFAMSFRVRTGGKTNRTFILPSADNEVQSERLYDRYGRLGLVSILLGTALQIYVSAMIL